MKKVLVAIIMLFLMMPVFADMKKTGEPEKWNIVQQTDGYIYILEPNDPNKRIFVVNEKTEDGKLCDRVTIICNGKTNHIERNHTLTCVGNRADMLSLFMEKKDFHNGASGTTYLEKKTRT